MLLWQHVFREITLNHTHSNAPQPVLSRKYREYLICNLPIGPFLTTPFVLTVDKQMSRLHGQGLPKKTFKQVCSFSRLSGYTEEKNGYCHMYPFKKGPLKKKYNMHLIWCSVDSSTSSKVIRWCNLYLQHTVTLL